MRIHSDFTANPDILPDGSVALKPSDWRHWGMAKIAGMPVTEVITMTLPAGWSHDDIVEFES